MDGKIFEKLIEVSECAFFISKPGGEMEITYARKILFNITIHKRGVSGEVQKQSYGCNPAGRKTES